MKKAEEARAASFPRGGVPHYALSGAALYWLRQMKQIQASHRLFSLVICRSSSPHLRSSPPLLCFRLVLTLMLTKRFVKQDLSGVEDEKQANRRGRSAAFHTGTVPERLKCRFVTECVGVTASRSDIQSPENI